MSVKKKFSPEEVKALQANPYLERVTAEQISFTLAFKEEFWCLSVEGFIGNMACRKLGYDPDVWASSASITSQNASATPLPHTFALC